MSREQEFLNAVQKGDVTKAKELLKTDRTLARAKKRYQVRRLGEVAVKGKQKLTEIFALLGCE